MSKLRAQSRNRQQRRKGLSEDSAELASTSGVSGRAKAMNGQIRRMPNVLGQAALLEWLGQAPIAFHRVYVDLTGGVLPALWLSSAMDRVARAHATSFEVNGDFVFAMSAHECEAVTGISRSQQVSCRKTLVKLGLISEHAEQRKTTVYRLHLDRIARGLLTQAAPLAEQLQKYEPLPELPASIQELTQQRMA